MLKLKPRRYRRPAYLAGLRYLVPLVVIKRMVVYTDFSTSVTRWEVRP